MRLAPVSLLYNIPFSKNISLASVLQQPFRTGSKHPKKWVVPYTGLGTKNGNITKNIIRRVLNRSPGVERAAALRLLLVLFVEAKRIKPFPFGKVLRFCKPRISAPLRGLSAAYGGYPCCCRNNCLPLRGFPGGKAAILAFPEGNISLLLKK